MAEAARPVSVRRCLSSYVLLVCTLSTCCCTVDVAFEAERVARLAGEAAATGAGLAGDRAGDLERPGERVRAGDLAGDFGCISAAAAAGFSARSFLVYSLAPTAFFGRVRAGEGDLRCGELLLVDEGRDLRLRD